MVVSGLPRSGTSMMMLLLEAGGLQPLTDAVRAADDDNPKGYYEFERVKKLPKGDVEWLPLAQGKVIKIIAALVPYLPPSYAYKVLFMRRAMPEILASQQKMLLNRGEDADKMHPDVIAHLFEKHLTEVYSWMDSQNVKYLNVDYNLMLKDPCQEVTRVSRFLDSGLDEKAMLVKVDPKLYRQRIG